MRLATLSAARARQWQRCFASRRYKRLLWRPEFPTDLPPALRQNAAVVRYAAPEVTPHKKTWVIHSHRKLHEVANDLCAKGAVHELAANIVYHAMAAIECQCPQEAARREFEFRNDLFSTCSNLFEAHYSHTGGESVFGILNGGTLLEISPAMRSNRRKKLKELVLDTIEEWVLLHHDSFSRIDGPLLLDVVGPKAFLELTPRLGLNLKVLRPEDIEVLFYHVTAESKELFMAMRLALSLLPVDDIRAPLGGSSWTLRRVLGLIEDRHSEHALRFLLSHVQPSSLVRELLQALRDRDIDTGLVRNQWSYMVSKLLESDMAAGNAVLGQIPAVWPGYAPPPPSLPPPAPIDEDREFSRGQRLWLTDGELMPFRTRRRVPLPLASLAPQSQLRDAPWPQLAFDPQEALTEKPSGAVDAYSVMEDGLQGSDSLVIWPGDGVTVAEEAPPPVVAGLPRPCAELPLDAIHFVDSAQGLSHVITYLQSALPAYVGVDLEWSDPYAVSIIQIATPHRAFVLDCVRKTPLYMSVLHCLMAWLLRRQETTKLFFGFPYDLLRLNMLFGPEGKSFTYEDHIASIVDLYTQRVRRATVFEARREDTPLGREDLLGEALEEEDLERVHELGSALPPLPLSEHAAERIYTVGGHHSLAGLAQKHLGVEMNKGLRTSNWNFRPLSALQVVYAATDAHILLRLEAALRESGAFPHRTFGSAYTVHPAVQPAWWRNYDRSSAGL